MHPFEKKRKLGYVSFLVFLSYLLQLVVEHHQIYLSILIRVLAFRLCEELRFYYQKFYFLSVCLRSTGDEILNFLLRRHNNKEVLFFHLHFFHRMIICFENVYIFPFDKLRNCVLVGIIHYGRPDRVYLTRPFLVCAWPTRLSRPDDIFPSSVSATEI